MYRYQQVFLLITSSRYLLLLPSASVGDSLNLSLLPPSKLNSYKILMFIRGFQRRHRKQSHVNFHILHLSDVMTPTMWQHDGDDTTWHAVDMRFCWRRRSLVITSLRRRPSIHSVHSCLSDWPSATVISSHWAFSSTFCFSGTVTSSKTTIVLV